MSSWTIEGEQLVHVRGGTAPARPVSLLAVLPEDAMPSRPRGDAKERTFNLLIRDGIANPDDKPEGLLIGDNDHPVPEFENCSDIPEENRELFGAILDDHYVIEIKTTRFLFPFQSFLPGTFKFKGRYKMFNGKILAFMCQPQSGGKGFNTELIDDFYELFNSDKGLTLLDATVLRIAREATPGGDERVATAQQLIARSYPGMPDGPGALLPGAHQRFQHDLTTILATRTLNRRDRVNAAISIFYIHLGLYFQRLAWLLEEEFALSLAALVDPTIQLARAESCFGAEWEDSPFAGTIRFRVGTGHTQPVSATDGIVTSYREQNRRQLLLPANLSVLGAARAVMRALRRDAGTWTFSRMVRECRDDVALARDFSDGLLMMARGVVQDQPRQDREDIERQACAGSPGLEVLREALLKTNRSALRRHGRDIVHQMVLRGGRGYLSSRGRSWFFYEMGQDLLLLLAKVIAGDHQMPFRQFVEELRRYGFEPQSRQEHDKLAEMLRALNLLEKHSDAGEAMYVKHFL